MARARSKAIVKSQSTAIGGRWTWATVENDARIVERLQLGMDITNTCRKFGIDKKSFYDRMRRDEAFAAKVNAARADLEAVLVGRVLGASEDPAHWKAAQWLLQKHFPKQWAEISKVELTGKNGGPVQLAKAELVERVKLAVLASDSDDGET